MFTRRKPIPRCLLRKKLFWNEWYLVKSQVVSRVHSCVIRNSMVITTNNLWRVNITNRNLWHGIFSTIVNTCKTALLFSDFPRYMYVVGVTKVCIRVFSVCLERILLCQAAENTMKKTSMKSNLEPFIEKWLTQLCLE